MVDIQVCAYLQNEDEVVDGFSALVKVVLRRALVALVESELLDDVGVPEDPQQDFLCDLEWAEQADLLGGQREQRSGTQAGILRRTHGLGGPRAASRPPVARNR